MLKTVIGGVVRASAINGRLAQVKRNPCLSAGEYSSSDTVGRWRAFHRHPSKGPAPVNPVNTGRAAHVETFARGAGDRASGGFHAELDNSVPGPPRRG